MFTKHISQRMAALADGQMSEPESRRAELHLRDCPRCRAEYEQVRAGMTMIKNLVLVDAPSGDMAPHRGRASDTSLAATLGASVSSRRPGSGGSGRRRILATWKLVD